MSYDETLNLSKEEKFRTCMKNMILKYTRLRLYIIKILRCALHPVAIYSTVFKYSYYNVLHLNIIYDIIHILYILLRIYSELCEQLDKGVPDLTFLIVV